MARMRTTLAAAVILSTLTACEFVPRGSGTVTDVGYDGGPLEDGVAAIWVDPDGCQHWVIDDGIEGYMTPRLNRDGTPRCSDQNRATQTITTKNGTTILMEPEPVL